MISLCQALRLSVYGSSCGGAWSSMIVLLLFHITLPLQLAQALLKQLFLLFQDQLDEVARVRKKHLCELK